jgi:hypothetical protein
MCRCIMALVCVCAVTGVAMAVGHPAPEVYLPMNGNANDASGNGHNATISGTLSGGDGYGSATFVTTPTTNGRTGGQGLDLDIDPLYIPYNFRTSSYLSTAIGDGNALVTLPYTMTESGSISMWYQTNDFMYAYQQIFDNSGTDWSRPEDDWEMWIDQAGYLGMRITKQSRNGDNYDSDMTKCFVGGITNSTWMHITATWQRLTWAPQAVDIGTDWEGATYVKMKMYINGALVDQTPDLKTDPITDPPAQDARAHVWSYDDPPYSMTGPGTTVYLGGGRYNEPANRGNTPGIGTYDEVAIWDVMLTDAEVMDVYLNGVMTSAPIPGDANGDGGVNDADAAILAAHWHVSSGAVWADGDFNADGKVDDKDASILAAHWSGTSEAVGPTVPEPSTFALLVGALLSVVFLRRK